MEQGLQPTADQQAALDRIRPYMQNGGPTPHLLAGYAGTGKTFIMKVLLKELPPFSTVVCAPTHKALKVIARATAGANCAYNTIQSLLMVKPVVDGKGNRSFESYAKPGMNIPIKMYQYIIIDEASMVDDVLYKLLRQHAPRGARILFIGDPAQLPPVSHKKGLKAMPFRAWKEEGIVVSTLKEIVRQKGGSNIIKMSMAYRNKQEPDSELITDDVQTIKYYEMMDYAMEIFDKNRENPDRLRILAYTNAEVNAINETIHYRLFPDAEDDICVGETIVLQEPYLLPDKDIIPNAEELRIVKIDRHMPYKAKLAAPGGGEPPFMTTIPVSLVTVTTETGFMRVIRVAEDPDEWNKKLEYAQSFIKKADPTSRKFLWRSYYDMRDQVATWKHAYAQTVHKSQGSTYEEAIVVMSDIRKSLMYNESYFELMYTAVTRPSNQLTICI